MHGIVLNFPFFLISCEYFFHGFQAFLHVGGLMERQAQNLQREAFGSKSGISRLALDILSS